MHRQERAFTLVEILTVIAIISALAAILFPVFIGVKGSALRASCITNMRQVGAASNLYGADYDDMFMPTNHMPGSKGNSRYDRTWVQLMLPYLKAFSVFHCPADTSRVARGDATFDQDLVPGETDTQYYTASMRSNYGYNYQNLAPNVRVNGVWQSQPKSMSAVAQPSRTLMYVDSLWTRSASGSPQGGGSWLVVPPCRYYQDARGKLTDSFTNSAGADVLVFTTANGWNLEEKVAPAAYGFAWPWHSERMNVANVDGSVRSVVPQKLGAGCDVRSDWQGAIKDASMYMWDVR